MAAMTIKTIYMAIKFREDNSNRPLVEEIVAAIEGAGATVTVFVRDFEKWGKVRFEPAAMMAKAFEETRKADALVIEFSEKGVGLGIEAGYAAALGKPVVVLARTGSEISDTLRGLATKLIFYNEPNEVTLSLREFFINK